MIGPPGDRRVWNSVRWLYVGSGVLFLANITLGIANVFSGDAIARAQILAHFHAGTIGWVTLSVIATALWVFTANRQTSDRCALFAEILTILGLVSVAGYILAFGTAFGSADLFWMLPLFGIPTWLVILSTLIFTIVELKHQAVVTTVHLLLFGALLVASLGATMGVLWGLTLSTGINPYPSGDGVEPVGAHAGPMDMYLALAFAGVIELMLRRDDKARWSKAGMTQMVLFVAGGFIAAIALYFGLGAIIPLGLLAFIAGFLVYLFRIGWRTFLKNPLGPGRTAGIFWGGLAFPLYIALFVIFVAVYFVPGKPIPHILEVAFAHIVFVGVATNLILATQSSYAPAGRSVMGWQAAGFLLMNLGIIVFLAGVHFADSRHGALVMAAGVLLSLAMVWVRLAKARHEQRMPPPSGPPPGVPRIPGAA